MKNMLSNKDNAHNTPGVTALTPAEIKNVAGGISKHTFKPVLAQDMYGNTLTHEEYMNFQLAVANGQAKPHDFDSWER